MLTKASLALGLLLLLVPVDVHAQEFPAAVLRVDYDRLLPVSRLDLPAEDLGFSGGALAVEDNNTTGRFTGHTYSLETVATPPDGAIDALRTLEAAGQSIIVVLADRDEMLALADAAAPETLLLNALAPDTDLRDAECRGNLLHIAPSRQMRTDALAQFLIWKRWREWLLVHGSNPKDQALAEAYRRSAAKFGAEIVEELEVVDEGGARRTDSGHVLVQRQLPVLTQDVEPDHDIVVTADESDYFAIYMPYHQWVASPVAGSAGLMPLSWHPANEAWGSTQVQRRFEALAGRYMREEDYHVWMALRVLGEVATRTGMGDKATILDYALSDEFEVAAFKGQAATFRNWNGQLRQSILLGDGRIMVSISPQEGFLHRTTTLDTLGLDRAESGCTQFGEN